MWTNFTSILDKRNDRFPLSRSKPGMCETSGIKDNNAGGIQANGEVRTIEGFNLKDDVHRGNVRCYQDNKFMKEVKGCLVILVFQRLMS